MVVCGFTRILSANGHSSVYSETVCLSKVNVMGTRYLQDDEVTTVWRYIHLFIIVVIIIIITDRDTRLLEAPAEDTPFN